MSANPSENYLSINKASWNSRLESHLSSEFYNMEGFLQGDTSLKEIEIDLLGDIRGKSVLHLQCHFGQDSISLSRLGAKVTAMDLSDKSIQKAKELAKETEEDVKFICCDIYDLPSHLEEQFDIVFTSYGTITWLPDLNRWAEVIAKFLKPEGKFTFVEFHPFIWMYDDDIEEIIYPYHNSGPIVEVEEGTYADPTADISQQNVTWNHAISEVVNSLTARKMSIEQLMEYDYAPYPFVRNCEESEPGRYRIQHFGNKIPLVYAIVATSMA